MKSKEFWVFLFLVGTIALNWPFLAIFGSGLPAYLFTAWFALIALIYLFVGHAIHGDDGG
jgi:hypothetical protein